MTEKKKETEFSFEEALKSLHDILEKLESGKLTLDASLKEYGKGIEIIRQAEKYLGNVETELKILSGENNDVIS